ncbi:MAG: autotransporter-associated beta strand repeat-containing protein [Luteolibacter sp.]
MKNPFSNPFLNLQPFNRRYRTSALTARRRSSLIVAGSIAALFAMPSAQATERTWSGGTSTAWATAANWGGTAPTNDLTTDTVFFNSSTYTNQPNAGTTSIAGISIGAGNTGASLTISGTSLSIGGTGITMASGSGVVTISATTVKLGANQSWANNSASLLTVSSAITNVGNVAPFTLTLNGSGAGGTTLSGLISDGGTTGKTAIIVDTTAGATTISGSGTNIYTGGLTLTKGTLNLNKASALGGSTGTFSIGNNAATATINNSTAGAITLGNNAQTWNGNFTFTGSQALTFGTGAITMTANTIVTGSASTLTEGGAIGGGAFTLSKAGGGTLVLNGNNTYNGLTTVSAGTLTLAGNNSGAGGVTLTAGTLNINNAGALGTGTLTITSGTINNSTAADITTSTNNNAQNWNGSFAFTGTKALNLGTGAVTLGANVTVTANGGTTGLASALTVGGTISGAGKSLTKAGTGTLILSGNNSSGYDGGTVINAGVLQFNAANAIAGSGQNVTVNYGTTAAFGYALDQATLTGRIVSGSNATVALAANSSNNLDFSAAGLTNLSLGASSGTFTYSGTLTPGGNIYRLGGGGGILTFNSALSGSNSLVVAGGGSGGAVTLVNAGTYNGGTTVTGTPGGATSTIGSVGGAGLLQTNILSGVSTTPFGTNAAITLNGGALGLGTAGALTGGQTVNAAGYDLTFSGQNAINLAAGAGSVTFAANTLTRANNGVLILNPTSGATLGNTEKVTVASGAPTVTNGMVSPFYINGTTRNFLTYDATNGFKDITYTIASGGSITTAFASAGATDTLSLSSGVFNLPLGGNKAIYALKLTNATGFNANALGNAGETLSLISGGLILDMVVNGSGYNFSSGVNLATINFGTNGATIGVFGSGGTANLGNNLPFIGTGGITFYGTGNTSGTNIQNTGGITLAGAKFQIANAGAFNSNNQLTIAKAATLQYAGSFSQQFLGLSGDGLVNASSGGGSLIIDGLTDTSTTTFSGLIQNGGGAIGLTKNGANTQVLSGANSYTNATNVNGGTLRLDFTGANAPTSNILNNVSNGSALTLGGGKLDIVGAAGVTNSQQLNGLTVNAGSSSISASSGASGTTNVTLGGTLTRSAGGTVNFDLPTSGTISTTATTFQTNGVLTSSATGPAFATVNGTDWATVTSGTIGALASYDTNDFSASTKNTNVTSSQGPAAFTINTLRFNTAATTLSLTGNNIIGTGGILVTSATLGAGNGATISGGTNIKSSTGNELVIINNGQLTMGSAIADGSGASGLTLSGSGTTTLNVANTFTGNAYLNSGTVVVGNAAAFGTTAGTLNLNGGTLQSSSAIVLNSKAISLNRNTTISGTNDLTLGGILTANNSSSTLTVNNTGATALSNGVVLTAALNVAGSGNLLASGVLSGAGALNYSGSGTMTLSNAASTYTGVTRVLGGTLSVGTLAAGGANSSIGKSTNAATSLVVDGGTFKYTGATVSTDRLFSVGASGGTIDSSSTNGSGGLTFSNVGSLGFNNTPGTRTLTLGGSNTDANTLAPIVSDMVGLYATSLTKSGAGQWVLTGANTYTGATAIQSGKLVVSGSIGNSAVTVSGTNTTLASGFTGTIGSSVTLTSGAILAAGDLSAIGTATVGGVSTFNSGSIFDWDLTVTDPSSTSSTTTFDKVITTNVASGDGLGIFRVVLGAGSFADTFWNSDHSWSTIFTTDGTTAVAANLASIFTSFSGTGIDTTGLASGQGQFTFNGSSSLSWSAVPEPTSALAGLLLGAGLLRRRRH